MKKQYFIAVLICFVMLISGNVIAQNNNLGIGTGTPDASAMLEILSNNKGLLVPRMTATERLAIPFPANALLVFDTDSACFYYYKQATTAWINLCKAFTEKDPKVGINSANYISKWNGSSLVTSNIYSSGTFTGINTTTPIGASQFVVGSASPSYSGMYVNTAGTAGARRPFYGYALEGFSSTWTYLEEASAQWRIYNNGDRMVVESSGNVGIGTLAPTQKLDVNGKLRVRDVTLDNLRDSILVVNGDGIVSYRTASSLAGAGVWSTSANDIYNLNSGNVGIGTSSPDASAQLDVSSNLKGFLPPRMTNVQRDNIAFPAAGLMIFNTDISVWQGFNGTNWVNTESTSCEPAAPGSISGNSDFQPNASGEIFSIVAVPGGTSYNWTVPGDAVITAGQGTTSITVDFGISPGNVSVRAESGCGNSVYQNLPVSCTTAAPGSISGNTDPDENAIGEVYSISAVAGATSYNWTVPVDAVITGGQGTISITVDFGTSPGNVSVQSVNVCGTSAYQNLSVSVGPQIGDFYAGGVIIYVDGSGGGLICAVSDQSSGAQWGCNNTLMAGADGTAIGTGAQNTIDIEAGCTTVGTPADICANLSLNGYNDWFLPSKDELYLMYQNRAMINATATANGGSSFITYNFYWSSSEYDTYYAWSLNFINGSQSNNVSKNNTGRVRAVRAF